MKETTQAKATAKTAFGWRNGLGAGQRGGRRAPASVLVRGVERRSLPLDVNVKLADAGRRPARGSARRPCERSPSRRAPAAEAGVARDVHVQQVARQGPRSGWPARAPAAACASSRSGATPADLPCGAPTTPATRRGPQPVWRRASTTRRSSSPSESARAVPRPAEAVRPDRTASALARAGAAPARRPSGARSRPPRHPRPPAAHRVTRTRPGAPARPTTRREPSVQASVRPGRRRVRELLGTPTGSRDDPDTYSTVLNLPKHGSYDPEQVLHHELVERLEAPPAARQRLRFELLVPKRSRRPRRSTAPTVGSARSRLAGGRPAPPGRAGRRRTSGPSRPGSGTSACSRGRSPRRPRCPPPAARGRRSGAAPS